MLLRRLLQLYLGLCLYGMSIGMYIRAGLGADPWDVFHIGVADHTSVSVGTVLIVTGALVLLLWIPLRQKPGLGTVSNVIVLGIAADLTLAALPPASGIVLQVLLLLTAVVLNGLATAMYIGAGFGPGPRDGLMTGLHGRTGWSLRLIRTTIEITVLAAGFLLGGPVGVGTLVYALAIGPLIQFFLPWFIPDRATQNKAESASPAE